MRQCIRQVDRWMTFGSIQYMQTLPEVASAQTRTFPEDNEWLNERARKRHTIAAVIIHEFIQKVKSREKVSVLES